MRTWNEFVAAAGEVFPFGVPGLAFFLLLLAIITSLLLYFWPAWWPGNWRRRGGNRSRRGFKWRWPRLRWPKFGKLRGLFRWRFGWRRRRRRGTAADPELPPDALPDLPAPVLILSADEYAAQGRWAEAVRERMRAIVRDLVDRGLLQHRPGWTITELAIAASRLVPSLEPPLRRSTEVFSRIWYGLQPAGPGDDAEMRRYAAEVMAVSVS